MEILCPACWNETEATHIVCGSCGATIDLYSLAYERRLVAELEGCSPERRIQICGALGCRGKRSAVPALIDLLQDPDNSVCEASIRGLGEIGDPSSADAVKKLLAHENGSIRGSARYVLRSLLGSKAEL
jgi:HEAT repeat protein